MSQLTPRIKTEYALLILMVGMVGASTSIGLQSNLSFLDWAWMRHHNMLSWSIRPWLIVVFAYFAYRHHVTGLLVTCVSLVTSMYWFPEPVISSPEVVMSLTTEQEFLYGLWNSEKTALIFLIFLSGILLGYAAWKHSLMWGLAAANSIVITKCFWSILQNREYGFPILPLIFVVLVAVNALSVYLHKTFEKKQLSEWSKFRLRNRFIINS